MQIVNQTKLLSDLSKTIELHTEKIDVYEKGFQAALKSTLEKHLDADISAETKVISILLSDLRGFTALSEKYSPLLVVELLNRYFTRMSEIIDQYNGVIDKFMGDSIMVLFGAIKNNQSDVSDALACAIHMQIAMSEINQISRSLGIEDLYMGIGINTGEVVTGTLGSDIYKEYTVIGDQVNLTSRVEAHSLRGQILLTENSYSLVENIVEIGEINEVHVKGKSEPIKMYELKALTAPVRLEVPSREIRKSPRVTANIPISFQLIKRKSVSPAIHQGIAIDISFGGLYARLNSFVEPFGEVKINIKFSAEESEYKDIYARIVKCHQAGDDFEVHLEFTAIEESARVALKDYINRLL